MTGLSGDERGVSEVLGGILIFGLVLAILALIQMHAVPAANANVEANHYEVVEEDLGQLQSAISRTATGGAGEAVRVNVGTRYPSRFVFVNPPPVSGTIRTEAARPLVLENVTALDGETADYLDFGSSGQTFETRSIFYTPEYHLLDDPGTTIFEPGVRYKQFENGENVQERGTLVNGRRITIVTVDGNLSETAVAASTLSTEPLSSTTASVAVRPNQSGNLTIRIPTNLSEKSWQERVLDDEFDPAQSHPDRFIQNISCTDQSVAFDEPCDAHLNITLEPDATYNLRMAKVGIGSGFTHPQEEYITDIQGDNESIAENGSQKLIVEVRDRYNNPVSGVEVEGNITKNATQDDSLTTLVNTTGSDGRAAFRYDAPEDVNGTKHAEITASFGGGGSQRNEARLNVTVMDSDGNVDVVEALCNSVDDPVLREMLDC